MGEIRWALALEAAQPLDRGNAAAFEADSNALRPAAARRVEGGVETAQADFDHAAGGPVAPGRHRAAAEPPVVARYELADSQGAALSGDGLRLALGREGFVEVIDFATHRSTRIAEAPGVTYSGPAYGLDGSIVTFAQDPDDTNCRGVRITSAGTEILDHDPGCNAGLFNPRIAPDGRVVVWHRQTVVSTSYRVEIR